MSQFSRLLRLVSSTSSTPTTLRPSKINRSVLHTRNQSSKVQTRISAVDNYIIRLLRHKIDHDIRSRNSDAQLAKEFDSFVIEDPRGEQLIRMRKKYRSTEDIKVEATMFDGFVSSSSIAISDDEDAYGKLRISLTVEVSKHSQSDSIGVVQFECSAWPDSLSIRKVFVKPGNDSFVSSPIFNGRDFKDLDSRLQQGLMDYLKERGVDVELSIFLHDYMTNKDRFELLNWMEVIKAYIEVRVTHRSVEN
ncbi:Mitochondrial glycoprotein family protein [Zostera marina]|uniref:Mitochondrial glycoprotein family protein n=1 Tax=Zostera marina TaxID=29655 RepID=A0A0K9PWJ9_ZOSMR|nr:Mitochondrial glycoprotein family protein [Zostera marina]